MVSTTADVLSKSGWELKFTLVLAQVAGGCKGNVRYRSMSVQDQRGSSIEKWLAVSGQKNLPRPWEGEDYP